jgi:adenylate cyclase
MVQPILVRKLKAMGVICTFTCLAGICYQFATERIVDYNSILVGLPLGINFALFELFLLKKTHKKLYRMPFVRIIVFKALFYTATVYFIASLTGLIGGYFKGKHVKEFYESIFSVDMALLILFTLSIYIFINFFIQLNRLLGPGVLFKFLVGKYYTPSEEERIFMFLDLKSSTQLAEKLGHKRYYSLLNDFFHEISESVLSTRAEIYQYVGDEVIFTWKIKEGILDENCIRIFFMIKDSLLEHYDDYLKKYGVVPSFKAGLHFGTVISAEIGDLKKEIAYSGDVLNTTSRIQEQCNKLECELLVSGNLMKHLGSTSRFITEKIATVKLRGKESSVDIYQIDMVGYICLFLKLNSTKSLKIFQIGFTSYGITL